MRRITYLIALALGLGVSVEALAQQGFGGGGGGGGFGGGGGGGSTFGGGGSSFGGGGSSFGGGGNLGGGGSALGGGTQFSGGGTQFSGGTGMTGSRPGATGPNRTGAGGRPVGGTGGFSISPTNFLASTYGNPLWAGRPGSQNISMAAASQQGGASTGFGQPWNTGGLGNSTTVLQTTGGLAGRGGALGGGRTGTASISGGLGGMRGNMPAITYATLVRFNAPPVSGTRIQADLQGLIARTTAIRQPSEVRIEVEDGVVVIRGRVADDDERRLVEGMVRLEPGVREVRNELEVR